MLQTGSKNRHTSSQHSPYCLYHSRAQCQRPGRHIQAASEHHTTLHTQGDPYTSLAAHQLRGLWPTKREVEREGEGEGGRGREGGREERESKREREREMESCIIIVGNAE